MLSNHFTPFVFVHSLDPCKVAAFSRHIMHTESIDWTNTSSGIGSRATPLLFPLEKVSPRTNIQSKYKGSPLKTISPNVRGHLKRDSGLSNVWKLIQPGSLSPCFSGCLLLNTSVSWLSRNCLKKHSGAGDTQLSRQQAVKSLTFRSSPLMHLANLAGAHVCNGYFCTKKDICFSNKEVSDARDEFRASRFDMAAWCDEVPGTKTHCCFALKGL